MDNERRDEIADRVSEEAHDSYSGMSTAAIVDIVAAALDEYAEGLTKDAQQHRDAYLSDLARETELEKRLAASVDLSEQWKARAMTSVQLAVDLGKILNEIKAMVDKQAGVVVAKHKSPAWKEEGGG